MEPGRVTRVAWAKVLAAASVSGAIGATVEAQFDAPPRKTECAV